MSVGQPKGLEAAHRQAEEETRAAEQSLSAAQQEMERQQEMLHRLLQFREEYGDRLQAGGGAGMGVAWFRDQRTFLERLDRAVQQQRDSVERARVERDRVQALWRAERARVAALAGVVERRQREVQQHLERREQQALDEHALRQWIQSER